MSSNIDIDVQLILRQAIIITLGRCSSCPRGRSVFLHRIPLEGSLSHAARLSVGGLGHLKSIIIFSIRPLEDAQGPLFKQDR